MDEQDQTSQVTLELIRDLDPRTAADRLSERPDAEIGALLAKVPNPSYAVEILEAGNVLRRHHGFAERGGHELASVARAVVDSDERCAQHADRLHDARSAGRRWI